MVHHQAVFFINNFNLCSVSTSFISLLQHLIGCFQIKVVFAAIVAKITLYPQN